MTNKYALIGLLALVVLASGCASQTNGEQDQSTLTKNAEKQIDVENNGDYYTGIVTKVEVDGHDCYLYDSGNGGGISCVK